MSAATDPSGGAGVRLDRSRLRGALAALVASGSFELPRPGHGGSAERLERLADIASGDLALARVAEAHLDGVTILCEAGRAPEPGALYGVWASDAPHAVLSVHRHHGEHTTETLDGSKAFCTGVGVVDRALVTARSPSGPLLVDIATTDLHIVAHHGDWITDAFADTMTATIEVDGMPIGPDDIVGAPGWYLERTGFWHGASAPAACWAGGAIGLVEHCLRLAEGRRGDDHLLAHLGVLDAAAWELRALLRAGGAAIDDASDDRHAAALQAYRFRTTVERVVTVVLDHAVRAHGPRLLAFDAWAARRVSELQLYVRQHHDTRDHAELGRLVRP